MTVDGAGARAWGGSAERKQAAVQAVANVLDRRLHVYYGTKLRLTAGTDPRAPSQFFCAAFDTEDPAELERRSGLPLAVLRLIGTVMTACSSLQPYDSEASIWRLAPEAERGALLALEAIPVGANLAAIPGRYLTALLSDLESGALLDGRALDPAAQQALSKIADLHRSASSDPAAFRAARLEAIHARNAASGRLEAPVLDFVESVAWPVDELVDELDQLISDLNYKLALECSRAQLTDEERRIYDVHSATMAEIVARVFGPDADPTADEEQLFHQLHEEAGQLPEVVAFQSAAFQARLAHLRRVVGDSRAPRTLAGLLDVLAAD